MIYAPMTAPPDPLTLAHLNLDVSELARSAAFYGDVLGLPVTRRPDSLLVAWPGGLLVLAPGAVTAAGSFHFGLRVESDAAVDRWFARFEVLGVAVVSPPEDRGAVYVGRIADPDGYPIEIYADRSRVPAGGA